MIFGCKLELFVYYTVTLWNLFILLFKAGSPCNDVYCEGWILVYVPAASHWHDPGKSGALSHTSLLQMGRVEVQLPPWLCWHYPSESGTLTHRALWLLLFLNGTVSSAPRWALLTPGEGGSSKEPTSSTFYHLVKPHSCWLGVEAQFHTVPHWYQGRGDKCADQPCLTLPLSVSLLPGGCGGSASHWTSLTQGWGEKWSAY